MEGNRPKTHTLCACAIAALISIVSQPTQAEEKTGHVRALINQALDGKRTSLRQTALHTLDDWGPHKLIKALQAPEQWPSNSARGRVAGVLSAGKRNNPFVLRVPDDYTPKRAWPLHISLHGGLKTPKDNCDRHWQTGLVDSGSILLCPSVPRGGWWHIWGEQSILKGLNHVMERYHIDPTQISIGGASLGGRGTWQIASMHPWLWKAAVPRCGPLPKPNELLLNIEDLPVYLLHGAIDPRVSVKRSREAHALLEDAGWTIRYEELPGVGHGFMRERNHEVARWLKTQPARQPRRSFTYRLSKSLELPSRVHWLRFDWGSAPKHDATITASFHSANSCAWTPFHPCFLLNRVILKTDARARAVTVLLPEALWAPDKPLQVEYNGKVVFLGIVKPSVQAVLQSWQDYRSAAGELTPWAVNIELPSVQATAQYRHSNRTDARAWRNTTNRVRVTSTKARNTRLHTPN